MNRKTIEVREFSAKVIDDPDYQRNVIKRIKAGQANHIETLLWHYRYGKPPERIQGEGFGPLLEIVLRRPLEEDPLADRTPLRVKEPNEHPGIVAVPESPSG